LAENKKRRRRYTREEKLIVLSEYSISKKSKTAFQKINIDFENISSDKKYFSKLINKWKKELYTNKNSLKNYSNFPKESGQKNKYDRADYITQDYIEYKKQKELEREKIAEKN